MLNWADLSGLMIILVGPYSGFAAAAMHRAAIAVDIFFAFVGLAVGIGISVVSRKLAYTTLKSETFPAGTRWFVYMLIPFLGLLFAFLLPFWLAKIFFGWR